MTRFWFSGASHYQGRQNTPLFLVWATGSWRLFYNCLLDFLFSVKVDVLKCASYHTHFPLLTWPIFAVQLDFIQRILTKNRFTTKSCKNCILGMKQCHTNGQGNRYVTTFTMYFYFARMTPNYLEIRKPRGKGEGRTLACV